jgi:hypothetical protein
LLHLVHFFVFFSSSRRQLKWGEKLGGWRVMVCDMRLPVKDKKDVVALHIHKDDISRDKSTKNGPYDELYLGIYTPDGVYIYKHDQLTGVAYKRDPNAKRNRSRSKKRTAQVKSPTPLFPTCGDPISPTCQESNSLFRARTRSPSSPTRARPITGAPSTSSSSGSSTRARTRREAAGRSHSFHGTIPS